MAVTKSCEPNWLKNSGLIPGSKLRSWDCNCSKSFACRVIKSDEVVGVRVLEVGGVEVGEDAVVGSSGWKQKSRAKEMWPKAKIAP